MSITVLEKANALAQVCQSSGRLLCECQYMFKCTEGEMYTLTSIFKICYEFSSELEE